MMKNWQSRLVIASLVLLGCVQFVGTTFGSETINVSHPTSSTVWTLNMDWREYYVNWGGASGSQVYMDIWRGDTNLGLYHPWTSNDGHAEAPGPGDSWRDKWGYGIDFRIQVIDQVGNHGFSGAFTALGAVATPTKFHMTKVDAPSDGNTGETGGWFGDSLAEATSTITGNEFEYNQASGPRDSAYITNGSSQTFGPGQISLHRQASILKVPVVPTTIGDLGWPVATWHPNIVGRNPDFTIVERQRSQHTEHSGAFRVDSDVSDLRLALTSTAVLDSFTLDNLAFKGANAFHKASIVAAGFTSEISIAGYTQFASHLGLFLVTTIIDEVVADSQYSALAEVDFKVNGAGGGARTIFDTDGYRINLLSHKREAFMKVVWSDSFSVVAGEEINWDADFRTDVGTIGYASAGSHIDSYSVSVFDGNHLIGSIGSYDRPIGGPAGSPLATQAYQDANGDGIPDGPTGSYDVFNKRGYPLDASAPYI